MLDVKIKMLDDRAVMPLYGSAGAGCFDLFPLEDVGVRFGVPKVIDLGIAFEIPPGHVMFVFSRSSHGFKFDVRLANGTGIIDSDYRDSVKLRLTRDTPGSVLFESHKAIAQAIILPFPLVQFHLVDELSDTVRGTGGFGSTDKVKP